MPEGPFFFEHDGRLYHPTPLTRGPWDPRTVHGRVFVGLIAHVIEAAYGDPDFQAARLTVDLFRMPMRVPVRAETRLVREGNRIRVADANLADEEGTELARGSVVMLRRAAPPEGQVWSPEIAPMPHPDTVAAEPPRPDSPFVPAWETRPVQGHFHGLGPKRIWLRDMNELVAGTPNTPFVRLALAADLTNPFSNGGTHGLNYVNAEVSLHAVRNPVGEWIGLESIAHHSADGIAVGECVMHDELGPLGRTSVCGVANTHRR